MTPDQKAELQVVIISILLVACFVIALLVPVK